MGRSANFTGPTQHGIYTNDYVTSDNFTGLVWKTCTEAASGPGCAGGGVVKVAWDTANTTTCAALNSANGGAGYAGITTWRLPTVEELETLINYSTQPATFVSSFPNPFMQPYWASSPPPVSGVSPWFVSFLDGYVGHDYSTPNGWSWYVRCVSGSYNPAPVLNDNADGTVTERNTGLVWQKCSMGENNGATCTGTATKDTWTNSLTYCNNLILGGRSDWRLPNINELKSIEYRKAAGSAIDTTYFSAPGFGGFFWSSSTQIIVKNSAWGSWIGENHVMGATKNNTYYARCVAGQ